MKAHHRDGSIFWLVFGIYVAIHAYSLGLGRFKHPGPGFIFFLASLFLIALSIIDFGISFVGRFKTNKEKEEEPIWSGSRWQKVLLVLVGLSIYTYMFSFLGFLLSVFLLLTFLYKVVEPTKWWISILTSLITTFFSYVIFNLWLGVPFPTGVLGF